LVVEKFNPYKIKLKQIEKNYELIKKIGFEHRGDKHLSNQQRLRRNLAIYRLYKYCNLSPTEIATQMLVSKGIIKNIIGNIFELLCLNDNSCVFKKILNQNRGEINEGL
jgi:hypothetical protein